MTETAPQTAETSVETPIALTAEAAERLKAEMERRGGDIKALRLMVMPGGCAGLQYGLSFAKTDPEKLETIVESAGVPIYVESRVLPLLEGSKIEWVDNLIGGGFRVNNPNAGQSCGCGKSFC